ncbi:MAG: CRTAC1 family protein [Acidobacteriota bacterium]|nr:MAG: CRTAC1 family protein [Acidobacteriota bacterium]
MFDLIENSGLSFVVEPSRTDKRHQPETMISGIAVFDYDNDGLLDVYIVSGATMPGLQKTLDTHTNRLFRNLGDWKFEDVTTKAGVQGRGYTNGTVVADYDNDGDQDIFIAGLRENIFYRNNGDGTFSDITKEAGFGNPDPDYGTLWSVAAAFLDYDNDGLLDLFVSNYCVWDPATEPVCGPQNSPDYCHPQHYDGLPNSLFHNNGDGTFTDVSKKSGIRDHIGKGMGLGVADFDDDGWIDIYVANDTVPAFLFHNQQDGTFQEIGFESGTAYTYSGAAVSGMGVDAKDVNNDGRVDLFVAAMTNEAMPYYENAGDMMFDEMTASSKLAMMTRDRTGWSNGIFDFNNDGWKDLFIASGDVMDPRGNFGERVLQPNTLFVNLKNGKFADAAPQAGDKFHTLRAVHRGAAFGDFDNDGRMDAIVSALSDPVEIWRNVSPTPNNWLTLSFTGKSSTRDAIGTKVKITTASGSQWGHVNIAVGYGCASDKRVHFGLGSDQLVEELQITWPNGLVEKKQDVKPNQFLSFVEP